MLLLLSYPTAYVLTATTIFRTYKIVGQNRNFLPEIQNRVIGFDKQGRVARIEAQQRKALFVDQYRFVSVDRQDRVSGIDNQNRSLVIH